MSIENPFKNEEEKESKFDELTKLRKEMNVPDKIIEQRRIEKGNN